MGNWFQDRFDEVDNEVKDLSNDPLRAVLAINSAGGTESVVKTGEEIKRAAAASVPDAPTLETTGKAPKLSDASVQAEAMAEEERNRKGRASNILTGGSSLLGSNGNANLARQTLLGS